jgi:hypothetical protein
MDVQKVDMFIMSNSKYFDSFQLQAIKQQLAGTSENKEAKLQILQFKDPSITLIISIFLGSLGIDRFFIGDIGLGIGKLVTIGGIGIWTIVDWFLIQRATKEKNLKTLEKALS